MPELSTVFIATCDLSAHVRGRAAPISRLEEVLASGTGWVPANLGITATGPTIDDHAFGTVGDLRLMPDRSTRCTIPSDNSHPGTEIYLADQTEADGTDWSCCPRTFLRKTIAELAHAGLQLRASFEHEFMVRDANPSQPFSLHRFRDIEPFGSQLVDLLDWVGLEPENWLPEYGNGQFEITLRPAPALTAADRAVLLRELVRDLGRRHGRRITFAPLVDPADVGNGVHIHFSLYDERGMPVMYDPAQPGRLSVLAGRFAAGVLRHSAALCAFTAASPTSYQRLIPDRWSAGGAFLADRDREAMLRICPTPGGAEIDIAAAFNLEFRAADATANPWLALAVLIRAGLHGIREAYDPAPVLMPGDDVARLQAQSLPKSLDDALAALNDDPVVTSWMDPRLVATYIAVKRADLAMLAESSERDWYARSADVY